MTQEVAIRQQEMTVTELRALASDFAKSGYFGDAKEVAQAVVKIAAGRELGFGPVYSMTKIYIVKGKVTVSAEALGAMVKRSGRYDYKVLVLSDTECGLEFFDKGQTAYVSRFTIQDATRAELVKPDSGWVKFPRAMLMSKALSQGARIVCPHVIAGVYTPEDFGADVNIETGEIVEPVQQALGSAAPNKAPVTPESSKVETRTATPDQSQSDHDEVGGEEAGFIKGTRIKETDLAGGSLASALKLAKWTETTAQSYIIQVLKVPMQGGERLADTLARCPVQQQEEFVKKLQERAEVSGKKEA